MRKFSFIILSLFFYFNGSAQEENALLWQISGNGLTSNSFIYGTIHLLPKDKYILPDHVGEAVSQSSTLITEINLNIPLKEQVELAKQMFLPDGKTYQDYMTPDEYQQLYDYMRDSLGIKKRKIKKIVRIKPFFASSLILKEYYGKIRSFEMEFKKIARKNKLDFDGLETLQDQIDLLNSITLEDQFKDLTFDLATFREFDALVDCYRNQDLECLQKILTEEEGIENFEEDFLFARNRNWIPKIESSMKESPAFIAVGAGHLVGDEGVINLLRDQGYTVLPVHK